MKYLYACFAVLLLAACQQHNPYVADGLPYPAAPAMAQGTDLSAYPAARRDFGAYRSWGWAAGELPVSSGRITSAELAERIAGELEQHGLRQASGENRPDLLVRARLRLSEVRIEQPPETTIGYGYGPYGSGYGVGRSFPAGGSGERQIMRLRIELNDSRDGQQVWSGSAADVSLGSGAEPETLQELIRKTFSSYPPQ
jgi:hypothetical protein